MKKFKLKVLNNFDKASNLYDNVAHVQKEAARLLIEKLIREHQQKFNTILDLGTGTGYMPELLLQHYPEALYTLNDIAPAMLEKAKFKFAKYDNFSFLAADMEDYDFEEHDLIISNFALQWVNQLSPMLQKLHYKSNIFAFSCLLAGTFQELHALLPTQLASIKYPQEQALLSHCRSFDAQGYFWSQDFQVTFPSLLDFMRYLKKLGAATHYTTFSPATLKSIISQNCSAFTTTYNVFFGIIKRL